MVSENAHTAGNISKFGNNITVNDLTYTVTCNENTVCRASGVGVGDGQAAGGRLLCSFGGRTVDTFLRLPKSQVHSCLLMLPNLLSFAPHPLSK